MHSVIEVISAIKMTKYLFLPSFPRKMTNKKPGQLTTSFLFYQKWEFNLLTKINKKPKVMIANTN